MPAILTDPDVEFSRMIDALSAMTRNSGMAAVGTTSRAVARLYNQLLSPTQLGVFEMGIMRVCAMHRSVTIALLASELEISPASIRRGLKVLLAQDLMQRLDKVGRRYRFALTPHGRKKLLVGIQCWDRAQQLLEQRLGPRGFRDLQARLTDLMRLTRGC